MWQHSCPYAAFGILHCTMVQCKIQQAASYSALTKVIVLIVWSLRGVRYLLVFLHHAGPKHPG